MYSKIFKKVIPGALALVMLIALGGCSTMTVTFDYDNNVDWDGHQTYAWLAPVDSAEESPAQSPLNSGLLDKRIREAVEYEMGERGITPGDNPDILVKYYLGTEEKVQVTDWGYRYSDYYWGYGGRQIDVYQFTQGTLVFDIIDAESKSLIWRGTATGTVEGEQRSPEEQEARVNNVVHKILEKFPPQ